MKAVILAAGLGSRLLPHTETRPKCLLKIAGHSILEYQLTALRQCGITDVVVVLGYQGQRIRDHVNAPVSFLENPEFASTGSSYSLWLAREALRDGFLYVNSDLIFHPKMLEALLAAPAPDAIVIDRSVNLTGDMQKAEMDGARILRMSKSLPAELAAAEVVGPAKFSAEGAARIFEYLDGQIAAGERSRWAYEAFGEVARDRPLVGVDNPGCFWAEVDTPADLIEAGQRIPAHFIDFRAPRLSTPDAPDDRRVWDIQRQPIPYMDRLLNAHLAGEVQATVGAEDRIRARLLDNRERFRASLVELGLDRLSPAAVHRAVEARIAGIEAGLARSYDPHALASAEGLDAILRDVLAACPSDLATGFVLTPTAAERLLETLPPPALMDALGHRDVRSLLRAEDPLNIVAMCRTTEDEAWQASYKHLLARLTAQHFEARPIRCFVADTARYARAFMNSKHPPKLWRISHNKETGIVTCLTLDDLERFRVPLLQYVIVCIHYFFETAYASAFYRQIAARDPQRLGEEIVRSIYSHSRKLTFFYSNVYSENLFWQKAVDVFTRAYPSDDARFFAGCVAQGEHVPSAGAQDAIVSLNLIDHIWNLNFLGHGVGVDAFQHDTIYFLYHFRGALWQAIVDDLTGLAPREMEDLIVSHLAIGDTALTGHLLGAARTQMV